VALDKPILEYATVETWRSGLREQWGEEPDLTDRLATIERFCDFTGKDPDSMIAECTREVESGKRIRIKGRREYSEKIAEFQASEGGTTSEQRKTGNLVRGFFIYNGIFMQAGLSG
jgi:hypothetical protein